MTAPTRSAGGVRPQARAGRVSLAGAGLGGAAATVAGGAVMLAAGLRVGQAVLGGRWLPGWLGPAGCWLLAVGAGCGLGCLAWRRLRRRQGLPDSHPLQLAGVAWCAAAASGGLVWLVMAL